MGMPYGTKVTTSFIKVSPASVPVVVRVGMVVKGGELPTRHMSPSSWVISMMGGIFVTGLFPKLVREMVSMFAVNNC